MRPTDDERREVAKALREFPLALAIAMNQGVHNKVFVTLGTLIQTAGIDQEHPEVLFSRLADLIEPQHGPDPDWLRWVEGLKDGDVVDRFAYDLIVHGGDMGPSGNRWDGVDEGMVLTNQLFDKFRSDFKASLIDPEGGDVDE